MRAKSTQREARTQEHTSQPQDDGVRVKKTPTRNRQKEAAAQDQSKNTGGGEQNRRKPKGADMEIEKNPPRDGDGKTAQDKKPRERSSRTA